MGYKAIIFDCDGTLVDSERVGNQVLIECLAEQGLQLELDDALRLFAGRKMADTLSIAEEKLGKTLPLQFVSQLRERMKQAFLEKLEAMPGTHELLRRISLPICIASNGPMDKMLVSLEVTGLLQFFQGRVYSGYECNSWKPDPGLFLYAAKAMGVNPKECAVVEDSIHGVTAGILAGMDVFGYAPKGNASVLEALGATSFQHMTDLLALIQSRQ
jgi:HAD superfamily hydrolase (TIGR01509 family)